MATEPVTIDLEDDADRWRYVCPRGHRSWEPTNNHFWCVTCARDHDQELDPVFNELVDRKEGVSLGRDDIVLMTEVGPYREVHKQSGKARGD